MKASNHTSKKPIRLFKTPFDESTQLAIAEVLDSGNVMTGEKVKDIFQEFGFTYIGTTEGTTFKDGWYHPDHILELYDSSWMGKREAIYDESVEPHLEKADTAIQDTIR